MKLDNNRKFRLSYTDILIIIVKITMRHISLSQTPNYIPRSSFQFKNLIIDGHNPTGLCMSIINKIVICEDRLI